MELLLNLIWISLAVVAFLGFMRGRRVSSQLAVVPYRKSLLALLCGVLLLFPVVSASDDLHPTQAVMEEASKRLQLVVAPLHLQSTSAPLFMLPATLTLCLMCWLVVLQLLRPSALKARLLNGSTVPSPGRAPPPSATESLRKCPTERHEAFCTNSLLAGLVLIG